MYIIYVRWLDLTVVAACAASLATTLSVFRHPFRREIQVRRTPPLLGMYVYTPCMTYI